MVSKASPFLVWGIAAILEGGICRCWA